jgi:hypothetical protein
MFLRQPLDVRVQAVAAHLGSLILRQDLPHRPIRLTG